MLPLLLLPSAGGAIVLPVSLAGSPPFTGLLDLSAATSILNWEAAALLGMTCTEQQQEERQWQQQQQLQKDGSSSSSSGAASKGIEASSSSSSSRSGSAANMYGYFGNIEVLPDAELLLQRPKLPGGSSSSSSSSGLLADEHHSQQQQQQHGQVAGHGDSSSNSLDSSVQSQQQHLPKISLPGMPGSKSSSSSSSSSSGRWLNGNVQPFNIPPGAKGSNSSSRSSSSSSSVGGFSPLRVQQHQAAASSVKLVLGHARLAAAATTNIGSSSSGSLLLSPPSRFGVAGLRGLAQLGLSGQPAMVVGADVWGRQRAVLCLKSGWLYLADRSPQVHQ
jgi:hypothetical protein